MTKTKAFLSVFGVVAAAGAVVASILIKNRGKVEVEGQIETKGDGLGRSKGIHGQATMNVNRPSPTR